MLNRQVVILIVAMIAAACGDGATGPSPGPRSDYERLRGPEIDLARRLYGEGKKQEGASILRRLAADPDWNVRSNAAAAMGDVRDRDLLPEVHALLKDAHLEVRESASRVVQWLGDSSSLAPLREALSDPEAIVRSNVAEALVRVGGVEAIGALRPVLERDADPGVRAMTAAALGAVHDPAVVPLLAAALGDSSVLVRARAAEALGDAGDESAREPLEKSAAGDPDSGVRAAAAAALRKVAARKPG